MGPLGKFGFIDMRFNRRASVGLIVRAPSPVTWCMVDCLLADVVEGVCVR